MKYHIPIAWSLFAFLLIGSSFQSIEKEIFIFKKHLNFQDFLKLLDLRKIDYGFTNGIDLYGDSTYKLYKRKITRTLGGAEALQIKSKNSFIRVVFRDGYNEIEKISYYSLKGAKKEGKIFYVNKAYQTDNYGFKVGDALSYCLRKLGSVDYKIEHFSSNYIPEKYIYVRIHGLIKFKGIADDSYDEYECSYRFYNNKLDLVEINYKRNVGLFSLNLNSWPQEENSK